MNTEQNDGYEVGYNDGEDFSSAINFMESIIKSIEESSGLKLIRGEDLETVYDELDIARSLSKAIEVLRGNRE